VLVVGRESPTAHPSLGENMKTELSCGLAGGLMYESGLMSRQTPIWAVAGTAEAAKAIREMPIIIVQSLVFRIGDQLHSDRSRVFCTINNVK